jgi:hypothetical protein
VEPSASKGLEREATSSPIEEAVSNTTVSPADASSSQPPARTGSSVSVPPADTSSNQPPARTVVKRIPRTVTKAITTPAALPSHVPLEASRDHVSIIKEKCVFYPNCTKGDACPFHHPTTTCTFWPQCSFGDKCVNYHPPIAPVKRELKPSIACKFGAGCTRGAECSFAHPPVAAVLSSSVSSSLSGSLPPPCKFGSFCRNRPTCTFWHPSFSSLSTSASASPSSSPDSVTISVTPSLPASAVIIPCRFGARCSRQATCMFDHAGLSSDSSATHEICRFDVNCNQVSCNRQHPQRDLQWIGQP